MASERPNGPSESPENLLKCSICGSSQKEVAAQLSGKQLKSLWRELGTTFTADAWRGITDDQSVEMFRCEDCGFLFFDPSLAGNEAFYQQLEHAEYFSPHRDEFRRTLDFARNQHVRRVLDVGCGSGIFLDMAREAGLQTVGIELNSKAAEKTRQKGHTILTKLLSDLDVEQTGGPFDLITLFQVLEHVPDPVKTLSEAKSLLKAGGLISIAVPSAEGLCRLAPWDPSLWPPHHVSLWRLADFPLLGKAVGMDLVESGGDILLGAGLEQRWRLHNRLAPVVEKPRLPGGEWLPSLVGVAYRKAGLKWLFPRRGSSIYAHFRKP